MYVSDGTVIFDKENALNATVITNASEVEHESSEIKSDVSPVLTKKNKVEKPKSLVTKTEIIQKKIEKQAILNKSKKTNFHFIPNSSDNSTFITSGKTNSKSAIVHQNHDQSAYVSVLKFIVLNHTTSSNRKQVLLSFIYNNSVGYFYSVRPPPSFT